ncbi:MAG TPA: hypothetical protein VFZ66_23240 [Herpetosiphonaceae bacterium]
MTTHPWRAALTRWGDTLYRLALLLTNDRAAAERATIQAFTESFATPSDDTEAAIYTALLRARPGRRRLFSRRALPRSLDRIAPLDRGLLGLWLLRDIDGPRLMAISGLTADALLSRLTTAITPLLEADDPASAEPTAQAALAGWLRRRLGLAAATQPSGTYDAALTGDWQAAIDSLRHTLREAVGRQHLPQACLETIEERLLEPRDEIAGNWWRQRAAWIGALAIVLSMLWMIKPWQQGSGESTAAALTSRELIQETLDAWTTTPVSGTLHRQVIATDPRMQRTPLTIDVWLAADTPQHRIEVRNKTTLVEWQIGNGTNRLQYAAEPAFSSCDWAVESGALDRRARTFDVPGEQQTTVRDARLIRGAYGQGYLALQEALAAPDLRSFGTRVENKTLLLVLGYTDRRSTPERKLLLWIDPATKKLHAVREIAEAGAQADARDLWRLQLDQATLTGISNAPPAWPRATSERTALLDPTCPALDPEHVVGLRTFVGSEWPRWQQWHLPAPTPAGITRAVLLSRSDITADSFNQDVTAVFIGPNRWLTLRSEPRDASHTNAIQHGRWRVVLDERSGLWSGSACRHFADSRSGFCVPAVTIAARGWTRDELLAMIDSLKPISGQTWRDLNKLFLEPQPLSAETQGVLEQSLLAIEQLKGQTLHSIAERSMSVDLGRPAWNDPYHLPLDLVAPDTTFQEQWLVYSGAEVAQFRDVLQARDGSVLYAQVSDSDEYAVYFMNSGTAWRGQLSAFRGWRPFAQSPGEHLLLLFLANNGQTTVVEREDTLLLEQPIERIVSDGEAYIQTFSGSPIATAWSNDLSPQRFIQRLWLDRATHLPSRAAIVHLGEQGQETEIIAVTIRSMERREAPPDDLALPPQPDDTFTFSIEEDRPALLLKGSLDLTPPDRTLVWPGSDDMQVTQDNPLNPAVYTAADRATRVQEALYSTFARLDTTELIRATTYRWSSVDRAVIVRQGSSALLRHMLRHQVAFSSGQTLTWKSSEALSASIAGEQRTVWLLEAETMTALVFEVDDLLVHVSGPDAATLKSAVLPQLSKLEWSPVE